MNTIITFDYELFLGPSTGTVENCLIKPTNEYLTIADKYNIKYVFFVDVLYLLKVRDYKDYYPSLFEDYEKVVGQLTHVAHLGHDLELHLHPQWYYSSYDESGWKLDYLHYKLSDCPLTDVEDMIKRGCKLLYNISGYRPKAYRAGGYSFSNNSEILNFFKQTGITCDSSVLMLNKASGQFQTYDYSMISDFSSFSFKENNVIKDTEGLFREYPISCSYYSHLYCSIKLKVEIYRNKRNMKVYGDGKGVGLLAPIDDVVIRKTFLKKIFERHLIKASLDFSNAAFLRDIYKRIKYRRGSLMVVIGHPKNTTKFSLRMFENFLKNIINTPIITFKDIQ